MASLSPEERATIVANNKALRNIKNELEFLAERGVVTDEVYDTILAALPAEAPLRSAATPAARPATSTTPSLPTRNSNAPLTDAFANMSVSNPPAPTTTTTQSVPPQSRTPQPPPQTQAAPSKPELCHATALYAYSGSDASDLQLLKDDAVSVTEYMNAEWWHGTNVRTGAEGIFPRTYVRVENHPSILSQRGTTSPPPGYSQGAYASGGNPAANNWGEKQGGYGQPAYGQPRHQAGGYGQPVYGQPQSNPYNNDVPPVAMANQPQDAEHGGKGKQYANKFGKKLGNAAIFGAGATIGGNIVNSIF